MKESVKSLVQRAQRGDAEAFGKLLETFQDAVFGAAWAVARNFHDAEDIAQEAFILAYQELPRLREPEKFPGWLRQITITACNRFLRSRKSGCHDISTVIDTSTDLAGPDSAAEAKEVKERILEEIGTPSEKNRLVTTLYFINGYSHEEISDFLKVQISTVKSRLHESRKKLQGRLIKMAKEVLHENKPGDEFVRQLREKLNGQITELPDGRIQVFYDFVSCKQLQDWQTFTPYKAAAKVKEGGLAFGRIEPEATENQWDRDIRLDLILDPDHQTDLEIEFDITMGTNEPWSCAAWILTRRDGYGPGISFFEGVITDWNDQWRRDRTDQIGNYNFKDGYLRADPLRRFVGDTAEKMRWAVRIEEVPLSESYHMNISRQKRKLCWGINDQTIGETALAKEELDLTERLAFANYGKGTGAVFRNVIIRSRILDVDPSWPARDNEGA